MDVFVKQRPANNGMPTDCAAGSVRTAHPYGETGLPRPMSFRAFVGVPVEAAPPVVALLDGLAASKADLKVVPPENMHMTLSFLGPIPDDAAGPLAAALDEALAGTRAFRARLRGVGAFPNARRPRVVWMGIEDPAPLVDVAAKARAAVAAAGHAGDDKEFRAHVTLARTRSPKNLGDLVRFLREHASDPLPEVPIDEVRLYRSTLRRPGPTYETVHAVRLEA